MTCKTCGRDLVEVRDYLLCREHFTARVGELEAENARLRASLEAAEAERASFKARMHLAQNGVGNERLMHSATRTRATNAEAALATVTASLTTIADEAFGPFPVQSTEATLTALERGIFALRRDLAAVTAEREAAKATAADWCAQAEQAEKRGRAAEERCGVLEMLLASAVGHVVISAGTGGLAESAAAWELHRRIVAAIRAPATPADTHPTPAPSPDLVPGLEFAIGEVEAVLANARAVGLPLVPAYTAAFDAVLTTLRADLERGGKRATSEVMATQPAPAPPFDLWSEATCGTYFADGAADAPEPPPPTLGSEPEPTPLPPAYVASLFDGEPHE